jgi:hypothetical protein
MATDTPLTLRMALTHLRQREEREHTLCELVFFPTMEGCTLRQVEQRWVTALEGTAILTERELIVTCQIPAKPAPLHGKAVWRVVWHTPLGNT